jgi:hypothetical protein
LFSPHKSKVEGDNKIYIFTRLGPYLIFEGVSAVIISPCQFLSLKDCDNPGKSKAIVNMNSIIAFILAIYFIKGTKLEMNKIRNENNYRYIYGFSGFSGCLFNYVSVSIK